MVRTGYVASAGGDVRNAKLGSLVHRPAAFCTPETTVADAARTMAEADVSCVLVQLGEDYGLLTDSDIRARLVAKGRSLETPVAEVMTTPALTFAADRLAIDAMIDMLDLGIHHLPVLGPDGTPMGVVTATDLLYLEGRTPFGLRRSIAHAPTLEAVVEAASHLPATVVALIRAGVPATDIGRVVALAGDTTTMRLVDLAFEEFGRAEWEWAWLALGSTARREASLASDQDNAFAYADGADDEYFGRVTTYVNTGLARCGFGEDNAEVLARNPVWRKSRSMWQEVFEACLEQPDRSHLVRAAVAFDFRHVWGGLEIVKPLVEIERTAHNHPAFVQRLARTATDLKVPVGFRGKLATDDDGRIDIKMGAIVPICNLARFHAIAAGVTISSTLARLDAAEAQGSLDGEMAAMLREAFEFCTRIRLEHQARQVAARVQPDNRLTPGELPPLARAQLKEALRAVQDAQKQLARFVPIGL
jgi:CBS domain-containing protein